MMKIEIMMAIRTAELVRQNPLASFSIYTWPSTNKVHNRATFAADSLIPIIIIIIIAGTAHLLAHSCYLLCSL